MKREERKGSTTETKATSNQKPLEFVREPIIEDMNEDIESSPQISI